MPSLRNRCRRDAALLNRIGRGRSTKRHLDRALQLKIGGDSGSLMTAMSGVSPSSGMGCRSG